MSWLLVWAILSQLFTSAPAGTATFYCRPGEQGTANCTAGYGPDDLVAAIDPRDTPFEKGDRVTVTHGSRSITVRIIDVCRCAGSRVIDLTSGAFSRLAPLSRGVIEVSLTAADPLPDLPPTDTAP